MRREQQHPRLFATPWVQQLGLLLVSCALVLYMILLSLVSRCNRFIPVDPIIQTTSTRRSSLIPMKKHDKDPGQVRHRLRRPSVTTGLAGRSGRWFSPGVWSADSLPETPGAGRPELAQGYTSDSGMKGIKPYKYSQQDKPTLCSCVMTKDTSLSCCIKDEGRPLGFGNQILESNYPMRPL